MDFLKTIFPIIGTLIGAGFASGQEVYNFFYLYGIRGIIGIFISSILMGLIIYRTFEIIENKKVNNYNEFLNAIIKNRRIKDIMSIIINIFILISFYVMIAGFGAYLKQEFNVNSFIGSSILAIICFLVFKTNIKGFVKINEVLIPILILIIMIMRDN